MLQVILVAVCVAGLSQDCGPKGTTSDILSSLLGLAFRRARPAFFQKISSMSHGLSLDDMVVMMSLLDADGDGKVTKTEFGVYYKRLNAVSDADFETVWREIDSDGDGILTLNELCAFYHIDTGECSQALASQKEMDDDRLLEALALQSLINEARQKEEMHKKAHAERLRRLAELADEMEDDEDVDEAATSPTSVTTTHAAPSLTMQEIVRESKRRGDIASRFFE
jgi:hypothetical protein